MKRNSTKKSTTPKPKKDLTWKGKKYKSPLEVFTAQALEANGLPNHYEGWTVPLVGKFTSQSPSWEQKEKTIKGTKSKEKVWEPLSANIRAITYTPDFPSATSLEGIGGGWVCEVKGQRFPAFDLKWKLFHNYLTSNGKEVTLYMPKTRDQVLWVINHIKTNQC